MTNIQNITQKIIQEALERCAKDGLISSEIPDIPINPPKKPEHGDFATSIALITAKAAKRPPRELAQLIIDRIQDDKGILESVEIAGPGFLNIRIAKDVWYRGLETILREKSDFGRGDKKPEPKINLEFVSANPTGPLHVGHGRGAAVGDSLARLLSFSGYSVKTEYYLNDTGRQVRNLGRSVQLRALEILKQEGSLDEANREIPEMPEDGYFGDYVMDIARSLLEEKGSEWIATRPDCEEISVFAAKRLTQALQQTLEKFNVRFDVWTSEKKLHESGAVEKTIEELKKESRLYDLDGALWFKTTDFGDEKDRVVIRETGEPTYFASDIAYHADKLNRGFDHLINVWGADHHGYVPRMKAAVEALGRTPETLETLLVQFVTLKRGDEKLSMGKRSGEFVSVDDLLDEVGTDPVRYFFLERRHDSHIDFDIETARSQDPTVNPAVYVQYGHARACSILKKAEEELGISRPNFSMETARQLANPDELKILRRMMDFPTIVENAAEAREPHRIVNYLQDLSRQFQSYYTRMKNDPVLPPPSIRQGNWKENWDWEKTSARLMWVEAVKTVCKNCLDILGLAAPQRMAQLSDD